MKKFTVILTLFLILLMVLGGGLSWAQKPERPLRTIIPPPQEEEAPPPSPPSEKATSPAGEKETPAPPQGEKAKEAPKVKTPKELEEEKKQRTEYLQAAQGLVDKLEQLRIIVQFGGEGEDFRKHLLEAGYALLRAKTKAQGPMAQAASLELLDSSANNFVRAKEAWEQSRNKRDEANQDYKKAEEAFPESQRRYYRDRRETALGGVTDLDAPWVKAYNDYKERGDTAKRESEQLMLLRDNYLSAAYSSLEAAKEALRGEGK